MNNIDSHHIKEALMHYFRFKRGWVCADEVMSGNFIADILVDTGKLSMEVEIKTTKNDLYGGEARKMVGWKGRGKNKHDEWVIGRTNKFALCVPEYLVDDAIKWIEETNNKYGLYIYFDKGWIQDKIWTKKIAKKLHNEYGNVNYIERIARRLSSIRAFELSYINEKKINYVGDFSNIPKSEIIKTDINQNEN